MSRLRSRRGPWGVILAAPLLAISLIVTSSVLYLPLVPPSPGGESAGQVSLSQPATGPLSSATLWVNNSNSAATGPFQLRLTEGIMTGDGFCWMRGVALNLSNLEFQYANGSVIPSWVETPCLGGPAGGVYGVDPTVWLSLYSIAAGSGDTITVTVQPTFLFAGTSAKEGEAPQLSPTYGEWDNGAVVFPVYDNFSGSTLPTAWTNDGFTVTMGAACGFSTTAIANRCLTVASSTTGYEGLGRQATASSHMGFSVMLDNGGNNGADIGIGNSSQSMTAVETANDGYLAGFDAQRSGAQSLSLNPFAGANFTHSPAVSNITTTQTYVATLSWSAAGNWVNGSLNYNWYVLSAKNTAATPPGSEEWLFGYEGATTSAYAVQWAREFYTPAVNVTTASTLPSHPFIAYKNETLTLTGYNPMAAYLVNGNGLGSAQLPTLASSATQPNGIYYVGNATTSCASPTLPFYEYVITTNLIRTVSCIVPLYTYGYNEMLDNEYYLEYGFDRALFFGTTASAGADYSIELVNLTTGALLMWNTTAAVDGANQEPFYVGNNSVMVLSGNGTIVGWNLVSLKTWTVATGVPSEANNDYWLPMRTQLIAVTAAGTTTDEVDQYNGTYNSQGQLILTLAATVTYTSNLLVNFVNGIGYNATWGGHGGIGFSDGYVGGDTVYVFVLAYGANGLLTTTGEKIYPSLTAATGQTGYGFQGQRYAYTSNWVVGDVNATTGYQYGVDLWNGTTIPLNTKIDAPYPLSTSKTPCANACFEGNYAPSINWEISYSLSTALNYPFYKVVYAYIGSLVPSSSPLSLTASSVTASSITLSISGTSASATYIHILENESGTLVTIANLSASTSTYSVTGLAPGTRYQFVAESFETGTLLQTSAQLNATTLQAPVADGGGGGCTGSPFVGMNCLAGVTTFFAVVVLLTGLILYAVVRRRSSP